MSASDLTHLPRLPSPSAILPVEDRPTAVGKETPPNANLTASSSARLTAHPHPHATPNDLRRVRTAARPARPAHPARRSRASPRPTSPPSPPQRGRGPGG